MNLINAFIRYERGKIVGVAMQPPSSEIDLWQRFTEADRASVELYQANPIAYSRPPQPNWSQFRASIGMHSGYLRMVTSHPINGVLNAQLVPLLWQSTDSPRYLLDAMNLWNAIAANVPPTAQEVSAFRSICQSCQMPFTVADSGFLIPVL